MAKAVKKKAAPRASRAKKPKTKDTLESLTAEVGAILDRVDAMLPGMTQVSWRWGGGPIGKLREEMEAVFSRMRELMDEDSDQNPQEVCMPDLSAPGGTVPSLARPGAWVEWVGYIPVLVHWGGFLGNGSDIRMVDPDEKWLNASGYQSLHIYPSRGDMDLRATVREQLEAAISPKKFDLKDVDEDGKDEARKLLADNEWLRRALEAGPVDPIRMPPKLRAVQTMPFA